MLSPYRVLDLTDEKGLLCGKLLGDLGADVIKIEPPGGDPARNIGPFYHDEVDPEKSLFWWAFNTSKRGITLDIEKADGQETFKKLVKTADFVIESFSPGYMDRLGLGYSALEKINPGIILVSITPFGQTGPYKDYKASDIVVWAMGGNMYAFGDPDRPPIRISHHSQSYLHAAAEASVGAMVALQYRERLGQGQHVDVSIQDSVAQVASWLTSWWDMLGVNQQRGQSHGNIHVTLFWPCKDGHVMWINWGGPISKRWGLPLIDWMDEEGMADEFIRNFNWETLDFSTATQELVNRLEEPMCKFFLAHTKAELFEGALKRRVMLYPVSTPKDIVESIQLSVRGFWVDLEHPELGTHITYPGAFAKASETPPRLCCRAPLIGEHNQEVYGKELLESRQVKNYSAIPFARSKRQNFGKKPLEGIKVADFSWVWTGPLTTKVLSNYGAQVIRVENKDVPDIMRTLPPFKDGIVGLNRASYFNQYNTGKLSITLNLAHPKGLGIARKLVTWADIVVENFSGGTMDKMGLGYEELIKINPDIIMLSTCMMGQTGPYAASRGDGNRLTALSGLTHIAGWPDREIPHLGAYTDWIAPHFNALVALAALDYQRRTGKGQHLDVSQYENGVEFLAPLILDYIVNHRVANTMGNRSASAVPHGAYRCCGEDRWCTIAVGTEEEWHRFVKVISSPDWANSPRFSTFEARKENEDELDRLVEDWTINRSAEEVMILLQAAGVAGGVVETGEDQLEHDPQLKHRNFFRKLDHPEIGQHYAPGSPYTLSKSPCELQRSPMLGEHNEYVLKQVLGMTDEEIAELAIEGVID